MVSRFFLVGAPRSGTTWLYWQLSQHRQIHTSPIKELHYYAPPYTDDKADILVDGDAVRALERGKIVHSAWIRDPTIYAELMTPIDGQAVAGEATVRYLHVEGAAERIRQDWPDARIIVLLRDPIDRAISHARMDLSAGRIANEIVAEIKTDLEVARRSGQADARHIGPSLYASACERYVDMFGAEAVLFLAYDDIQQRPDVVTDYVAQHLGVTSEGFDADGQRHVNAGIRPRWPRLNALIQNAGLKSMLRDTLPSPILSFGKSLFYGASDGCSIRTQLCSELQPYFASDIERTMELTGLDLSTWLSGH